MRARTVSAPACGKIMRRSLAVLSCVSLAMMVLAFYWAGDESVVRVFYNTSSSAPIGFYWRRVVPMYTTGNYVFARLPQDALIVAAQRGYLPSNVLLLKRIAAVEGDF